MDKLTKKKLEALRLEAVKRRDSTFTGGDSAVLLYRRKGRVANVPVQIMGIIFDVGVGSNGGDLKVLAYVVRSELGGELTVPAADLRPGSVLDRISIALESDDELDELKRRDDELG
jgi:hypothetical protein